VCNKGVHLLAFAAGVLLTTAFLDLLPEALHESGDNPSTFSAGLTGVALSFFLERFIINFHPHTHENHHEVEKQSLVGLVLFGDGFHNFIDGFAIATSFLVSVPLGITTALAVAAHEIPLEISDFAILLRSNLGVTRAIWFNILSGLTALVGAGLALFFAESIEPYLGLVLAFTGGMFIYIAATNIIPELNHVYIRERKWHQMAFFVAGLLVMYLAIQHLHLD
jgi:zinc and cadmium transporter